MDRLKLFDFQKKRKKKDTCSCVYSRSLMFFFFIVTSLGKVNVNCPWLGFASPTKSENFPISCPNP